MRLPLVNKINISSFFMGEGGGQRFGGGRQCDGDGDGGRGGGHNV